MLSFASRLVDRTRATLRSPRPETDLALLSAAAVEGGVRFAMLRLEDVTGLTLLLAIRSGGGAASLQQIRAVIEILRRATPVVSQGAGRATLLSVLIGGRTVRVGTQTTFGLARNALRLVLG
ncbi:MAG TPA: hypothetical protein VMW35_14590 [Myxococcota bacterium]|nr:hypothetical protein [Myxococcota bacterium]